jgi:hypothetical protein
MANLLPLSPWHISNHNAATTAIHESGTGILRTDKQLWQHQSMMTRKSSWHTPFTISRFFLSRQAWFWWQEYL